MGNLKLSTFLLQDQELGGQDDWFLSSSEELHQMYLQRTAIDKLGLNRYWSSSESSEGNARSLDFSTYTSYSSSKYGTYYVRCIRSF
jgi:hypothetical protein